MIFHPCFLPAEGREDLLSHAGEVVAGGWGSRQLEGSDKSDAGLRGAGEPAGGNPELTVSS